MEVVFSIILGLVALVYVRNILIGTLLKLFPRKLPPMPKELPTISVLVPCFNEGTGIYGTLKSLASADYPPELFDVIVIDDCSTDDSTQWIQKGIEEFTNINIKVIVQEVNQGKQAALIRGTHASTGKLIVLFDSDVQVNPDVLKAFARELQDPKVGIVGASCGVYNPNDNLISQGYTSMFYTLHEWLKQIESAMECISVVDGKASGFRREIYEAAEHDMENRRWLDLKMMAGEDRFITHHLTLLGYKSRVVLERVNTSAPTDLTFLYKQQIRWRRSGLRDFFWTIGTVRMHINKIGFMRTSSLLLSRTTYLLVPLIYLRLIYEYGILAMLEAQMAFLVFVIFIKLIMNVHAWIFQRDQALKDPVLSSIGLTAWFFVDLLLTTPIALLTLDEGGWGTRNLSTVDTGNSHEKTHSNSV